MDPVNKMTALVYIMVWYMYAIIWTHVGPANWRIIYQIMLIMVLSVDKILLSTH